MLRDMLSEIPAVLSIHFFGMEYRQIALFLFIIAASILFKTVLADFLAILLRKFIFKGGTAEHFFEVMEKPIATLLMVAGFYLAFTVFPMEEVWRKFTGKFFYAIINIVVFWGLVKALGVGSDILVAQGRLRGIAVATFVPLFKKILVAVLVIICAIVIIDAFGYSVTSIIAALGIGGAALAFASQSTIANLYGSIAIALDRPFKVGDSIKVAQIEGVVESIGLRSTLIRTDANTLVSMPNNMVATEAVDNKTAISKQRIAITVGLAYGTTRKQIEDIVGNIPKFLTEIDHDLSPSPRYVYLGAFGEAAIKIEVVCATKSTVFGDLAAIRQKILLEIMRIVEEAGTSLAQPAQKIHLVNERT